MGAWQKTPLQNTRPVRAEVAPFLCVGRAPLSSHGDKHPEVTSFGGGDCHSGRT